MASLLPGNETPSKPLAAWPPPNSFPRPVGGASGPPGRPDDTWESVAGGSNLDGGRLIWFNFHTNNSKEVNWYLRTYVGCNTPSPTRWNWTFKDAKPGIIYIPVRTIDYDDEGPIKVGPGVQDFKWEEPDFDFEDPHWFEWFKRTMSVLDPAHILAELGGLHLGLLGEFFGGVAPFWLALELLEKTVGQFEEEQVVNNCKDQYFWGISYGVVLAADQRQADFIVSRRFDRRPVHMAKFPEFEGRFEQAYQMGLAAGFVYGRKMNTDQSNRFRRAVRSHMDMTDYPPFDDKEAWRRGRALTNYYVDAARSFHQHLLRYLLNGFLQTYLKSS